MDNFGDFVDIVPVIKFSLAAYPNFLLLGTVRKINNSLMFDEKQFLKMYIDDLKEWITTFKKLTKEDCEHEGTFETSNVINSWKKIDSENIQINDCTFRPIDLRKLLAKIPFVALKCFCMNDAVEFYLQELFNHFLHFSADNYDESFKNLKQCTKLQSLKLIRLLVDKYQISSNVLCIANTFMRMKQFFILMFKLVHEM